jgi:hypothetical protein
MELKPYQQQVINDLSLFLEPVQATKDTREAFHQFWTNYPGTPLQPFPGTAIEPFPTLEKLFFIFRWKSTDAYEVKIIDHHG